MTMQHGTKNHIELTGNPFVDNGLAVIAARGQCKNIKDLTLRKIKKIHGNGMKLARSNNRLKSTHSLFLDSMLTNPSFSKNPDKAKNYAKITTAILNNIDHEEIQELCDICGNTSSVDLSKIFEKTLPDKKRNKNRKVKGNSKGKRQEKKYLCRDWFPLAGSMGSDAQALPSASRSLNMCAKCLFAVQYLPQGVFLTKGKLTLFQSTSTTFWYRLVKRFADQISDRLAVRSDKVETIGSKKDREGGNGAAVNSIISIMEDIQEFEPNTSLIMWMFSNGREPDCELERIPNFALNFLHEAAKYGLAEEIQRLMIIERRNKRSYMYSFLSCIIKKLDYLPLYPSKKFKNEGASPELFFLYETKVRNYPTKSLDTAYNIAQYVNTKLDADDKKQGIDIDTDIKKQTKVKKRIIEMAKEGKITFDEYYNLFVSSPHLGNPWRLVKYYMVSNVRRFKAIVKVEDKLTNYEQDHKNRVIDVGTAIYDSYIRRRGGKSFEKHVLGGLQHNHLHASWLRTQFQRLSEENEDFDLDANWKALCINKLGEESVYDFLDLLRVFFTYLHYNSTIETKSDAGVQNEPIHFPH